jgi:aminopeptidase N
VRLVDYRAPAWTIDRIELEFDLDFDATRVASRLFVHRNGRHAEPLRLDGEGLQLLALRIDEREVAADGYQCDSRGLILALDGDHAVIDTVVQIAPSANTAFEGLYASRGFLLTQCEAEGFRRITWFIDRPDAMARFSVTLRADAKRFPVLLCNGDLDASGELADGRHFARWIDPHPKPCYLFALVAGSLAVLTDRFTTAEDREVVLHIYAEPDAIDRCAHAMDSLKRAMRWDEQRYGRCYDLDQFNIVATHDFNMGAMENKGLNIFNARYIVADADTATDDDFLRIEAVVAHEYLHNWTGNRITCRDWFQLSLKEGLTVFREQQFVADAHSRAVRRIDDVRLLRSAQFAEDAGPFAHPVRPDSYVEINNFYTATVYEKGAEIVRMLHSVLGEAGFRRGMDEYFRRHDGQAVTCDDFRAALAQANAVDLDAFARWYAQAGTPVLHASGEYDPVGKRYALSLRQHTAPTPGQDHKLPVPIPVRMALFDPQGRALPLRLAGEAQAIGEERVLLFDAASAQFVFEDIACAPVASLLRDFSAPVQLQSDEAPAALALLARHDSDAFNRWEAIQRLAEHVLLAGYAGNAAQGWKRALLEALDALLRDPAQDPAFVAECLLLPDEGWLGERIDAVDPVRLHSQREALRAGLGQQLAEPMERALDALAGDDGAAVDARAQARRRLKNVLFGLRTAADRDACATRLVRQLAQARNMTDRLAALTLRVHAGMSGALEEAVAFQQRFAHDPLVVGKWLALQASSPQPDTLARVQALTADPAFSWRNPNKVRALIGTFSRSNRVCFHRIDGAGYRLLADAVLIVDPLNPQVAARLAGALNGWRKLEAGRRVLMRAELQRLSAHGALSPDVGEIVGRALA